MRLQRLLMPVAIALLAAFAWLAAAPSAPPDGGEYFVYVGSYTDPPSHSKGIYAWRFSPASGAVRSLGLVAQTVNPAFVHATSDGRFLFATNWQTADAEKTDTVSAYAIDAKSGALTLLNTASAGGGLPNQVVVDPRGTIAAVTNYGFRTTDPGFDNSSFAALTIRPDGRLEPLYVDRHAGPASNARQPSGGHTHGVVFTKDDRFAFVAELGLDRIYTYRVDPAKPAVAPSTPPFVTMSAGSGPRRLVLSPNDRFLYVNHETDSKVSVFSVDEGRLAEIQQISTLPTGFSGRNTTAEIQIDKPARFLYVSNRGADTIAMFTVDAAKGTLTLREFFPALGRTPRNITIDPSGRYLFVSNQGSNQVVVFAIDAATGRLTSTGTKLEIDQPGSVFFVKAAATAAPRQITWTFDRLDAIGGLTPTIEGHPKIVDSPIGKAVEFDGVGDSLLIEQHPLAGSETFTFEAIFRPDGGANEQRWFHLAEIDPKTGLATSVEKTTTDPNARFLFEIRVVDENQWYLDAFINGPGYNKALMFADKRYPIGRWYHVAQVYDGRWYRSYVDGELQGEAEVKFKPQGPGRTSVGVRMNKVNYFHGAIAKARFTAAPLPVSEFLTVSGK